MGLGRISQRPEANSVGPPADAAGWSARCLGWNHGTDAAAAHG